MRPPPPATGATDASWEVQVAQAIAALLQRIDSLLPIMTSRPGGGLLARQLAAGGLVRCVRLIRAMLLLQTAYPDINGLLARNLWETSTLALYALLDDPAAHDPDATDDPTALDYLAGDLARNAKVLIERNDLGDLEELVASSGVEPARINLEDVARKLGPLLQKAGDPGAQVTDGYDLLYRSESTYGAIHGIRTMSPYAELTTEPWQLQFEPGPLTVARAIVHPALGALYTTILAQHVAQAFGIGTTQLDAPFTNLTALLNNRDDE